MSASVEIKPTQTVYVKNLNDKIKKEELKLLLYALFSPFGRIVDIVCLKTMKMRGQAFIVYQEIEEATSALKALEGFMFYDKQMRLFYSKTKSKAARALDGEFNESKRVLDSDSVNTSENKRLRPNEFVPETEEEEEKEQQKQNEQVEEDEEEEMDMSD